MTCDISNSLDDNIFRQTCMFKELNERMNHSRLIIISIFKGYGKAVFSWRTFITSYRKVTSELLGKLLNRITLHSQL